jgi:hypothetical protein
MNILINYAHLNYYSSREENTSTGLKVGGFDRVIEYGVEDINEDYRVKFANILNQRRGAGYWMWKPYIIHKTLQRMTTEDVLFYCDSGASFVNDVEPYTNTCKQDRKGIILFRGGHINKIYTKRDCFVYMGCDDEKYTNAVQLTASFQIVRKTDFTIAFYKEFMRYAKNENIISDLPNACGLPNYSDFEDHRHDQSILTNLSVKHKIKTLPDPSQCGNHMREEGFPCIIDHHRRH